MRVEYSRQGMSIIRILPFAASLLSVELVPSHHLHTRVCEVQVDERARRM